MSKEKYHDENEKNDDDVDDDVDHPRLRVVGGSVARINEPGSCARSVDPKKRYGPKKGSPSAAPKSGRSDSARDRGPQNAKRPRSKVTSNTS